MSSNNSEYRDLFLEEAPMHIQEWETALLGLEKSPGEKELIDTLFRAIHTLKGAAGFIGYADLQNMLHEIESVLQSVRDGTCALAAPSMEGLFEGLDAAKKMIDAFANNQSLSIDTQAIVTRIQAAQASPEPAAAAAGKKTVYRISIEVTAPPRERYVRALLAQSRLENVAAVITLTPTLEDLRAQGADFLYEVVVETAAGREKIERALALDAVVVRGISEMSPAAQAGTAPAPKAAMQTAQAPAGSPAPTAPTPAAGQPAAVPAPAAQAAEVETSTQGGTGAAMKSGENVIRVPAAKLDILLNLVGELVVQNAGFISISSELKGVYGRNRLIGMLDEKTEALARVARELQDSVMKVRMLPIASVFTRFTRVVRDLARSRGKQVIMDTFGEETEIDKKVIDRIGDPLVHLVRNAVDHGLETPDERVAIGKDPTGHVKLGAYQEGDHIFIEISDDGRGLSREKILKKGIEKGLVNPADAERLSTDEIFSLIFLPGFSTAEKVTDVSGRGVGLDVVKRSVEEMNGTVSLSSQKGKGATFTITLPLTMAIIRAIMVKSNGALFAIPLSSVNEVVKVDISSYQTVCQETVVRLRDQILPIVRLDDMLELGERETVDEGTKPIVIVSYGDRQVGLVVDELIGNTEIVIKSLARHYREVDGFVGASILGNGRIALILDVKTLLNVHMRRDGAHPLASAMSAGVSAAQAPSPAAKGKAQPRPPEEASLKAQAAPAPEPSRASAQPAPALAAPAPVQPAPVQTAEADARSTILSLSEKDKELLADVHSTSAIEASRSMTSLMGQNVQVSFPELSVVPIASVAPMLGGDEAPVARIYIGIKGEIAGGCLIVLPIEEAQRFCDQMYHRPSGATREIGEEEVSGLSEMGNILSASFINALADHTGLAAVNEVPDFCTDMCLPAIDSVLARFTQPGDEVLLTRAELFSGDNEKTVCNLLLFLEAGALSAVSTALARGPGGKPGSGR